MEGPERRMGIFEELELLARRGRFLLLGIPVLLVLGLGVGKLIGSVLTMPEGTSARLVTAGTSGDLRLTSLTRRMDRMRTAGDTTADYIRMYQTEVAPVERVLRGRGVSVELARRVAWPLVEQAYSSGVDPATVLSVMLVESAFRPRATSSVGARGLMQVMPSWAGYWRGCGRDLYDIEDNLCHGTKILAWYLERFGGDERRALLGYNGCVRGTVTPNCRTYPDKIDRIRRQIRSELEAARRFPDGLATGTPADD